VAPGGAAAGSGWAAAAAAAAKPKPTAPVGGGTYHPSQVAPKPATTAATPAATAAAPTGAPKKNDCGCNGDLMCLMKCSTAH